MAKQSEAINRMKMPQGRPAKFRSGRCGDRKRERERRLNRQDTFVCLKGLGIDGRNSKFILRLRESFVHRNLAIARRGNKRRGRIARRLGPFAATTALGFRGFHCLCGRHRFGTANANRIGQNQAQPRHHHCLPVRFHCRQTRGNAPQCQLEVKKHATVDSLVHPPLRWVLSLNH